MFRATHAVKFGAYGVCPKCNRLARLLRACKEQGLRSMNAFEEHRDELEHFEQMYGRERGRLAVSLDRMTNALVLVGQHGVYCTSQRNPAVPAMDLRIIAQELEHAKQLVQSVMEELKRTREGRDVTGDS
jgi:hypothetical protein